MHPDFNSPLLFNFSLLSLLFYPVQITLLCPPYIPFILLYIPLTWLNGIRHTN